jgi:tRNA1Val (adenine37-N6)-methyltransferase
MGNSYFEFKQFTVYHDRCAFKVGTDGVLLGACASVERATRILDIGTGSGLIALMLAQRSDARITALEPDPVSWQQACENINNSRWGDRIEVLNTKIQNYKPEHSFDLIVSNPPYFSDSLPNPDSRKAAARHNHDLTRADLLSSAARLMSGNGSFEVIMPYVEGNLLIAEAVDHKLYCTALIKVRPLPTSQISRMIITFSKNREKVTERFLTIEHGRRHEFTDDYIRLTRDYYLKF